MQQYTFSGSLAKKISSTVAVLMAEARKLEASCDEPTLKNEIILSLKVRMSSEREKHSDFLNAYLLHEIAALIS